MKIFIVLVYSIEEREDESDILMLEETYAYASEESAKKKYESNLNCEGWCAKIEEVEINSITVVIQLNVN